MPTLKGIWKFNNTISMDGWAAGADALKEYVNFISYKSANPQQYIYIGFNLQHYTYSNGSGTLDNLQYLKTSTTADRSYVWGKRSVDTYSLGWQYQQQRIIDFGETAQTVSDAFYAWFTSNATTNTDISYNGEVIASIEAGQTATLECSEKRAIGSIEVAFGSTGNISYNTNETNINTGQRATLDCAGKKMLTNVIIYTNKLD